jgi:hypothetical protein
MPCCIDTAVVAWAIMLLKINSENQRDERRFVIGEEIVKII